MPEIENPFAKLVKAPVPTAFDEWGGQFSCQSYGCWEVVNIAKYSRKDKVLTWKCPGGHVSILEDVHE